MAACLYVFSWVRLLASFIEVLINVFLEVASKVCSLIGLNGSCNYANQSKGTSKETCIRTSRTEVFPSQVGYSYSI